MCRTPAPRPRDSSHVSRHVHRSCGRSSTSTHLPYQDLGLIAEELSATHQLERSVSGQHSPVIASHAAQNVRASTGSATSEAR
jgi:hypothetical protein